MENACVFCKIAKGEMPADIVDQSKNFIVFPDINPHAPVHLLLVSKNHYKDITEVPDEIWIEGKQLVLRLANEHRMDGFRFAVNYGSSSHMKHFHIHFLGNIGQEAHM
jgi:histidine triad (HIT) family protein